MESSQTPSAEGVQLALERVLASGPFANSKRSQRLLRHIVESSLKHQDESLKEFAIAVDVFERDASYDPSVDATVRVEAGRMRSRLRDYYADEGRNDPVVIVVAKGAYRATFIQRTDSTGAMASDTANSLPGGVVLLSQVGDGNIEVGAAMSAGFRTARNERLAMRLTTGAVVFVASLGVAFWYLHRPLPPPRITGYTRITNDGAQKWVMATDGNRLYFTQNQPNSINQIGVAGGEVARIPVSLPGYFWTLDISPDGSSLLVTSLEANSKETSLWIVRVLGGMSRLIGHSVDATFSPDGKTIAYLSLEGDLLLAQDDGTGEHKIASPGENTGNLAWSPDGKVIRFSHEGAIWEISAKGSNLHEVLPGWPNRGSECCGRWTPNGKFYIFTSEVQGYPGRMIWALDERRGLFRRPSAEPIQLTAGPISWSDPVPGKGKDRIFSAGETARGELSRFDPKTKQLQPFLGGISAQDVSFSKDGRFVAYVSFPDGILWKANRDGRNLVQLSTPALHARNPRWSPDGSKIVFEDYEEREADRIYLVSSQGGIPERLPPYRGNQDDPMWSADGSRIVFASGGVNPKDGQSLAFLDISTGQVTPVPGSYGLWSPRWSPDGKLIAAFSQPSRDVKVLDVATQRWSTLSASRLIDYPAWSSDSKYIYFIRRESGDQGVYRLRATGGKEEPVADLKDWHITGYSITWMALDPTDTPLLLRDVGTDDIYALTLEDK